MVYLQNKSPTSGFGVSWRVLQWKMLVYYAAIWFILRLYGIACVHLAYFMDISYIFSHFGMLHKEKSGNLERKAQ
jgi:hypothetical protein